MNTASDLVRKSRWAVMSPARRLTESWREAGVHGGPPRSLPDCDVRLPYPNSWYSVCLSTELLPGRLVRQRLAGEDLVVYRTRSGRVCAVRPFCPHLGTHLGYGGRVDGEDIVCPFHHFAYDPSGACVRTGYGTAPPTALSLTLVPVREVDGIVVVWYHAQNELPDWTIPDALPPDLRPTVVRTDILVDHPQEFMENAFDIGHFQPVHHAEVAYSEFDFNNQFCNISIGFQGRGITFSTIAPVHLKATVYGLGIVAVKAEIPAFRTVFRFWGMSTPVDPFHIEIRWALRFERLFGFRARISLRWLERIILHMLRSDAKRDYPIWQNKRYLARPRLAKGDGPIMKYRRWARQFYSIEQE
ncbi:Rieske 2Fe-2S domain-containing protein [Nocardia sp. NPDC052316]|uniref:Rieske 2Fe-2S domain-containing protein n=1 Tax=Nocardia sp. NPDC052316 TaxID=3364329 RepID=UPI0037C55CCB